MPTKTDAQTTAARRQQPGRGRDAHRPTQIPGAGWKDIFWRVYNEFSDDRVMLVAAGVTYYLLLAFIPALSALVSIYGFFADPATVQTQLSALEGVVPDGAMEILNEQLTRLVSQSTQSLSFTFALSLAIALWSTNAGVKALFEAMNVAYDEGEKRGFVKLMAVSLTFTLAGILAAIVFVLVVIVMPNVLGFLGLGGAAEWLVRIASYVGMFLLASIGVAALYRWGPSREQARWAWITPGCLLTVGVVLVVSLLFSWYVANFGSYNATYGSLGAVIGFMTWIWISTTILIIGAEVNAEMEHQTAEDTTSAPARPLGSRGATMADNVGPAVGGSEADDPEYGAGKGSRPPPDAPAGNRRRVSLPQLAFTLPAALLLGWYERKRQR